MIRKMLFLLTLVCSTVIFMQCSKDLSDPGIDKAGPSKGGGPGGETETAGNNLSFPALAIDGFAINPLANPEFTSQYTGDYPGLTAEEISYCESNGPWYPQKTDGNVWQAGYDDLSSVDVTYIDWGDNIESVSPKIRSPFRLEMTLYTALGTTMEGYTMAVLEYPSSSTELQGTNNTKYNSNYATVISNRPKLVVQYLGASVPTDLTWSGTKWISPAKEYPVSNVPFAPELNVGGKYVYGASQGGWKPTQLGYYRITFYIPSGSGVNLANGMVANASTGYSAPSEGVATAVLDTGNNLTYIDVLVKGSGGGGRR